MLRTLRIREMVIIEDLTLDFSPGLNLLTGETGAGKSILVDALGLAVGERADRSLVRSGAQRMIVEAQFEIPDGSPLSEWAAERGMQEWVDEGQVIVRREVPASGTGRILINGSPFNLGVLREVGGLLLELHGQHEHQSLLSPEQHLLLLDRFGGHHDLVDDVGVCCSAVLATRERVEQLRRRAEARQTREHELAVTLREIDSVGPRPGERDELERERRVLKNSARMSQLLDEVVTLAYDGDPAASSLAYAAARRASELAALDDSLEELASRVESAALELQEAGVAFRDYRDRGDIDPRRLDDLEARLVALERLCLTYGPDEQAVLARRREAEQELAGLRDFDKERERLESAVARAEQRYVETAASLGRARRAASRKLGPAVEKQLKQLALPNARFKVELSPARGPDVERGGSPSVALHSRGAERAEFLLAANPGEPFRPLARVASGGELSRIMLALHGVVDDALEQRVLVFDEVDSGVGGAVADAVGDRLARLAEQYQVLCVTHLPQVAAYARQHHVVRKRVAGGRTRAEVRSLARDERVEELARMLGGKRPTAASRRHATELLDGAARPRRPAPRRRA